MVKPTLRASLWLFVVALGVLARPLYAQDTAGGVAVKTYTGFFENTAVYFTAFETNSSNFAAVNGIVYAPRLSNANSAGLADMIFFTGTGGTTATGQTVILQTAPGRSDYSPFWRVLQAQWRGSGQPPLITSYAQASQLSQQGLLAVQNTGIIFNGPVVWVNMSLDRQGGNRAPTISPNEFLGIDAASRAVFLRPHYAYYAGQQVAFLALEHAPGVIAFAPGATPVPKIGLDFIGHGATANLYEVQGQPLPILDSVPVRQVTVTNPVGYGTAGKAPGQAGQQPVAGQTGQQPIAGQTGQQPIAGQTGQQPGQTGQLPGQTGQTGQLPLGGDVGQQPVSTQQPGYNPWPYAGYSQPMYAALYSGNWHVHQVVFRTGATPQPLLSIEQLQAALNAGLVSLAGGDPDDVFNCPVVTAPQPIGQPVNPNPVNPFVPPGGTPVTPTNPIPATPTPGTGSPY